MINLLVENKKKIPKYILISIVIVLFITAFFEIFMGYYSSFWEMTTGVIINKESKARGGESIVGSRTGNQTLFFGGVYTKIYYSYQVNGNNYISNRVSYPDENYWDSEKNVKIYYNEYLPSLSVLKPGIKIPIFQIVALSFLLAFYISLEVLKKMKR